MGAALDSKTQTNIAARIAAGLDELELPATDTQLQQLSSFTELVLKWNKAVNLVSRQDVGRFVPRHLLDSLTVAEFVCAGRVIDIGTGGGLPGMPLAIMLPTCTFTLVDRSEKKIRFIQQAVRALGLQNVTPLAADAATLEQSPKFQTAVSRAVAGPAKLWRLAQPLLGASTPSQAGQTENATPRLILQAQVTPGAIDAGSAGKIQPVDPLSLGFTEEQANQIDIERHATRVPGLQSTHQILLLSRRTSRRTSI